MIFGFKANKCKGNVYTKEETDILLESYKLQGDIKKITGQLSSGSANIDYPSGFNKDNCVVLSVSFDNTNLSSRQWSYGSAFNFDSSLTANVPYDLAMTDTQIILTTKMIVLNDGTYPVVSDSEADYNYKLVLMKI